MRTMVVLTAVALAACGSEGGGGGPPPTSAPAPTPTPTPTPLPTPSPTPSPASVEREFAPFALDGRVADDRPHVAINPAPGTAKGRLFVMLPGAGGPPRGYRLIVREAAARGYNAIGLAYDNDLAVNSICPSSPDADCAGNVRREIVLGEDRSPLVTIAPPASIVGRLSTLLAHLARVAPGEGWDAFLVGGQPNWALIRIGGHSQGSGHAGYMTKLYALDRVAMFSGPGDLGAGGRGLASWLALPAVTPVARMFGFIHRDDELVPSGFAQQQWRALGLDAFGAATDVDGSGAHAGTSHMLLTSVPPNPAGSTPSGSPFHGATVVDPVTPLDASGRPLFAGTWAYMVFP